MNISSPAILPSLQAIRGYTINHCLAAITYKQKIIIKKTEGFVMDTQAGFFRLNLVSLLSFLSLLYFSPNAFSDPAYSLESCSKLIGTSSKNCYQDDTANGWANTANGPLDGWANNDIQGWHGAETADYRYNIALPASGDAATYYIRVEHDHMQNGVVAVDDAKKFYVGAGTNSGLTEGQMTKHCATVPGGSSLPSLPYQGDECVVAGPTFTGMDDDGDGRVDEEIVNGLDDDGDGLIDEDPMPDCASTNGAQHIQYTAAVHFDPDEAGNSSSNWGLYWLAHLAQDSNNFPGGSVETRVRAHREGDADPADCPITPEPPITPDPAVYCDGAVATIVGTTGVDHITGTSGNDIIFGMGGGDYIHAGAGNDTLCGGDGVDHFYGDDGDDVIETGAGNDYVWGGTGNDQIFTGDGNVHVYGDDGDDTVETGNGSNYVYGGAGNDHITSGSGNDHLYGEDGNDTVDAGDGDNYAYGGAGIDHVTSGSGKDHVYGDDGDDIVESGAGDDYAYGGAGNDLVLAGDGADHVSGDDGDDIVDGGAGNDIVNGGYGNDTMVGGDGDDSLNGYYGDDTLDGSAGTDVCIGGPDTDSATNCETLYSIP